MFFSDSSPASDARERLLGSATQLFWERSYASVSIEEICERADVKKGSFHAFFPSKARLLLDALGKERRRDHSIVRRAFSAHDRPLARFLGLCRESYEIQRRKRAECGRVCGWFAGVIGSEIAFREEIIRREVVREIDEIVAEIERAVIRPLFDSLAPAARTRSRAATLFCYLQGCLMTARIRNDLQPVRDMVLGIPLIQFPAAAKPGSGLPPPAA